jgi:hypothetical protein
MSRRPVTAAEMRHSLQAMLKDKYAGLTLPQYARDTGIKLALLKRILAGEDPGPIVAHDGAVLTTKSDDPENARWEFARPKHQYVPWLAPEYPTTKYREYEIGHIEGQYYIRPADDDDAIVGFCGPDGFPSLKAARLAVDRAHDGCPKCPPQPGEPRRGTLAWGPWAARRHEGSNPMEQYPCPRCVQWVLWAPKGTVHRRHGAPSREYLTRELARGRQIGMVRARAVLRALWPAIAARRKAWRAKQAKDRIAARQDGRRRFKRGMRVRASATAIRVQIVTPGTTGVVLGFGRGAQSERVRVLIDGQQIAVAHHPQYWEAQGGQ